jgi:hypothetical protein
MSLHAIAYVSTAARDLSTDDLDLIVAECARLNAAARITGVLLYCDGNFMQYLEGPTEAVARVFERICASGRHHQVHVLMDEAIVEREFAHWTTARAPGPELAFLDGPGPAGERVGPGLGMLRTFWRNCRTAADPGL